MARNLACHRYACGCVSGEIACAVLWQEFLVIVGYEYAYNETVKWQLLNSDDSAVVSTDIIVHSICRCNSVADVVM